MKFFRIKKTWDGKTMGGCDVKWHLYMPRIICPKCGPNRSTELPGFSYPAADFANAPTIKRALQPNEIPLKEWQQFVGRVLAALPYKVIVTPGTFFGQKTVEISGKPFDCYLSRTCLVLSSSCLEKLQSLGIQDLFPVPVRVKSKRKISEPFFELQIEHTASLCGELNIKGRMARMTEMGFKQTKADYRCLTCGKNIGEMPATIKIKGSSIPENVSLFRLREKPAEIFCNEIFANAIKQLKIPDILCEPVKTDGSEKNHGFAKITPSQPQLWNNKAKKGAPGETKKAARPVVVRPLKLPPLSTLLKSAGLQNKSDELKNLAQPTIRFLLNPVDKLPAGSSRFGGLPDLPEGIKWPGSSKAPLDFLLQLNLADLVSVWPDVPLPKSGFLWFFYDTEKCSYGDELEDKKGWKVLFHQGRNSDLVPSALPDWSSEDAILPQCKVVFSKADSLPSKNSPKVAVLNFNPKQLEAYKTILQKLSDTSNDEQAIHKLLGYPDTVQNEMTETVASMQKGALKNSEEWLLLLQLDSDLVGKTEWADGGKLYFWIHKKDLIVGRFDRCWVILQTH